MTNSNNSKPTPTSPTKPATPAPTGSPKSQTGQPSATANPLLPKTWSEIRVGSLVIAQESALDGWWEATVTEVRDDVLTLRWRDYPRQPAVTRNRKDVALLFPAT